MVERKASNGLNSEFERGRVGELVIGAVGKENVVFAEGRTQRGAPFLYSKAVMGDLSEMGVGLFFPESGRAAIWGLMIPHMVIRSWRAMKILEHATVITNHTLAQAYEAGKRPDDLGRGIEDLRSFIPNFDSIREEILEQAPTPEELDLILNTFVENNVHIEAWELMKEIEAGRIESSPLIEKLIADYEKKQQEYEAERAERERQNKWYRKLPRRIFSRSHHGTEKFEDGGSGF